MSEDDVTDGIPHQLWCPAYYRTDVAAALSTLRAQIAALEKERDGLRGCLCGISEFPISDPKNQDAWNMGKMARAALSPAQEG